MIDLRDDHMQLVRRILAEQVPECEVWAFGSRVSWTAGDNSDLDLVVVGAGRPGWQTMAGIKDAFEESILPFRVDVLDWHAIPENFHKNILEEYEVIQDAGVKATIPAGGEWVKMRDKHWKEVTLGDIFSVKHGFAFKGEFFTNEQKPTILVTPGKFAIGGGFQNQKPKYYGGQVPEDYVLKPGQIIVTMTDLSK